MRSTESESEESSDSAAYDSVKTRLSELEAKVVESTNHKARILAL